MTRRSKRCTPELIKLLHLLQIAANRVRINGPGPGGRRPAEDRSICRLRTARPAIGVPKVVGTGGVDLGTRGPRREPYRIGSASRPRAGREESAGSR